MDFSELTVQITLTVQELRDMVALMYMATDAVLASGAEIPPVVDEVTGLYVELIENLQDGILGDFEPEPE